MKRYWKAVATVAVAALVLGLYLPPGPHSGRPILTHLPGGKGGSANH